MKPVYKKTIFQKIQEVKDEAAHFGRELDYIEITEEEQRELCAKRARYIKAYRGNWKCVEDCYRCHKTQGQRAYDIRLRLEPEPKHVAMRKYGESLNNVYDSCIAAGIDPLKYMNL